LPAALLLELGDALPELLHLLRLRLVRVAVMPRPRLLLAQRRIAMAASGGEKQRQERKPHSARLRRCSISAGGKKPVTRAGPSPGTAHSGGRSSLQAIINTVG